MTLLNVVTVVCIGLLVGTEFAVSAFVNPVLWKLDGHARAGAVRMLARDLGFVMPIWYAGSFVFMIVETIVRWHSPAVTMLIVAGAIWAAVIVLTLVFLVPINNQMARIEPDAWTEQTLREHRKWDARHRFRIAALAASWVCLLLAIQV
ncbi:MAG TPA: DUF1772 domain-containing protein [Terracidiphilus sp.]|nr:DUF1772 domain-containing protein [Terracidiphilus sp.]